MRDCSHRSADEQRSYVLAVTVGEREIYRHIAVSADFGNLAVDFTLKSIVYNRLVRYLGSAHTLYGSGSPCIAVENRNV